MTSVQSLGGLFLWLVVCYGAAWLGARSTIPSIPGWYAGLRQPSFSPPNWVFGPVWTVLYTLMAVAAWLVWQRSGEGHVTPALALFGLQLALNVVWSLLFFGRHEIGLALADLAALWTAVLMTILLFWPFSPLAGALLLPYLAWVSFAGVLNYALWRLNP
ncbi:MAG TPA: TspO/MBR family protein [Armatimonadota bacterium]|jgi:tryptophan-rich sensory protein